MTQGSLEISAHGRRTQMKDKIFRIACASFTWFGVFILFILIGQIIWNGIGHLDWQFLTSMPSGKAEKAGLKAAIVGTVWLISLTALFAVPVGVCAAIYLEEYASKNRFNNFLETNISNLAGVPSIVYGILGLAIFVRFFGFGESLLAGGLTLSLLVMPIIIVASREALRAVPSGFRTSSYALGSTKWQTTWKVVLPVAIPGILTGIILSLSRAIGETAPLILAGAATYVGFMPEGPMDRYTALPIQIYQWASEPKEEFKEIAASGIIVLLAILFLMNGLAIMLRHRYIQKLKG